MTLDQNAVLIKTNEALTRRLAEQVNIVCQLEVLYTNAVEELSALKAQVEPENVPMAPEESVETDGEVIMGTESST